MPKKTRKAKIRASQRPISAGPVAAPVAPSPRPEQTHEVLTARSVAPAPTPTTRSVAATTWDYTYVAQDLRRIGLLAAFFFGLMFVLWFLVEVQGIHLIPGVF